MLQERLQKWREEKANRKKQVDQRLGPSKPFAFRHVDQMAFNKPLAPLPPVKVSYTLLLSSIDMHADVGEYVFMDNKYSFVVFNFVSSVLLEFDILFLHRDIQTIIMIMTPDVQLSHKY